MSNAISFSHLVDDVMSRSHRPALPGNISDVSSYANSTIIQVANTGLYKRDLMELMITVTSTQGHYIWQRPRNFRQMQAVRYNVIGPEGFIYPLRREPGRDVDSDGIYYYYYSGDSIVFNGVTQDQIIALAFYTRPRRLPYFADGKRPAYYDLMLDAWVEDENVMVPDPPAGVTEEEFRRGMSANWPILDWYELIAEGTVTKYFNKLGDERAKSTYAVFRELIKDVPRTEIIGHTEFMQLPANTSGVLNSTSQQGAVQ